MKNVYNSRKKVNIDRTKFNIKSKLGHKSETSSFSEDELHGL